jgi:hypothetical protein
MQAVSRQADRMRVGDGTGPHEHGGRQPPFLPLPPGRLPTATPPGNFPWFGGTRPL